MEALSKSIEQLKKSSSQIIYDTELTKIVQDFSSEMEVAVGDACTSEMTEEDQTEIAYFVDIVNAISSNKAFLSRVSIDKISSTLNAAQQKSCMCSKKPCKPEAIIQGMVDSYVKRLQDLRNSGNER
ncbi:hypothetical protein QUA00_26065 [Microcoleus sp. T2B6]|uniref:hypothetical protein n=1 Tax=Microcoleus sp. T2B6 TaxID=3055424 RepID=UPI002FD70F09